MNRKIRLGFVPSYRSRFSDWCAKMRQDSLDALSSIGEIDVVVPQPSGDSHTVDPVNGRTPYGAVRGLDQADAVAEFFRREKVEGLVICPLDFGDERSPAKIAEHLGVPVLLYATKEPPARDDSGLSRVSDSYCGNLSIASALYRRKIPFYFAGIFFPDEPEFVDIVRDFVASVAVVSGLMGARIGQIGVRPASFETVAYDEVAMIQKFKQNVIHANLSDITSRALALEPDDPSVQETIREIREEVAEVTVADDYLLNVARLELALADFYRTSDLSAMAMQCWPSIQRLMGISVCALYGRLTGKGMLTACETDILGALSMIINHRASLGKVVPHFIDWTIQHRADPNRLLAWHCGNAPVCLAADPAKTALRSRRDMRGDQPVREGDGSAGLYQFQLAPGDVTICRLAEYDNKWKLLIAKGEIVPSDETLAGTWAWVRVPDHQRLYRLLVEEGFIHHASMIHGDQVSALRMACKFLDITPIVYE